MYTLQFEMHGDLLFITSGVLEDNLSIEDALDAIIQEEDMSANSKATLEIKETDEENDNSDEDDAEKH